MAMKKSVPARLPRKEIIQTFARLMSEARRCRKAVNMNCGASGTGDPSGQNEHLTMTLLVKRSEPLRTIMMSPTGKNTAETVRIRPGAFS